MLPTVLSMLQSAQQLSVMQQQSSDEESLEYNTSLRISIFEAYSGIFNGLSAPKISQYLKAPAEVTHIFLCFAMSRIFFLRSRAQQAMLRPIGLSCVLFCSVMQTASLKARCQCSKSLMGVNTFKIHIGHIQVACVQLQ